ncbi:MULTISPECIES: hypothetical protein [Aeromicrobium]|uniref:hypothetical protein n=1 Tax=Aeromicrobium TaxID=2040 RepID=UPI00257F66B2|nr:MULTISPECIES: hypothetical protein [Aeromicrobium]
MRPGKSESDPTRGRTWYWNISCLVFLALALLAFQSSQAWDAPAVPDLAPPFDTPSVAASFPSLGDVSGSVGGSVVLYSEGPPQVQAFTSNSAMAQDLRAAVVTGAWERTWVTLDDSVEVQIRVYEVRRAASTYGQTDHCTQGDELSLSSDAGRARYEGSGNGRERYCANLSAGRTRAYVDLSVRAAHSSQVNPQQALSGLLDAIQVNTSPDEPPPDVYGSQQRAAILAAWIVAVPFGALLSVLPALVFDRATYQRAISHLCRRRLRGHQVDVTKDVSAAAAKSRAIGAARLAALLWAVRLTEELWLGVFGSLAVVVVAYLATLFVERHLVNRQAGRNVTTAFTGRRVWWIATGAALTILVMAGATWLWAAGAAMSAGVTAPGLPDWQVRRTGVIMQCIAGAILLGSLLPLALARRIAMRRAPAPEDDTRPPILLLRSFVDDKLRMRSRRLDRSGVLDQLALRRRERFEEVAAAALSKIGPVIAVGTPGQALPPGLGAVRIQLSHEEWQDKVTEIAEHTAFLAMTLGRTESLVWEIRQIHARGQLDKTLFLVPPLPRSERALRINTLADVYGVPRESLWPSAGSVPLVIAFPRDHDEPLVLVARAADDLAYDAGIHQAVATLLRADVSAPLPIGHAAPREPTDVIPMGMAKPHKTWKREPWAWYLIVNVGVLSLAIPFVLGGTVGVQADVAAVELNPDYSITHVLSGSGNQPLVILNGIHATRVNFEDSTIEPAWQFGAPVEEAIFDDGTVYSALRDDGTVQARDADSGVVRWTRSLGDRVRGLSVANETLYVSLPGERKVLALAAGSGEVTQEAELKGHPWDVLALGKFVYVPLIDRNELVELDGRSFEVDGRIHTDRAPSEVTSWGGTPTVISRADHVAVRLLPGEETLQVVWLARTQGEVLGIGPLLLAEGHDRLTAVHVDGRIQRLNTLGGHDDGLAITGGGVVVAEDSMLRLFGL